MIRQYRFLSICEQELAESIDYYNDISFELGREFFENLDSTIARLLYLPGIGVAVGDGLRSFPIRKFPYNIIYRVDRDEIIIVAVAHQSRRPQYWKGRL